MLHDNLCFILDLEGLFINKTFHARELGYFTWNQDHGRFAFFVPVPYNTLCDKDKRTVNSVISKIHGRVALSFLEDLSRVESREGLRRIVSDFCEL